MSGAVQNTGDTGATTPPPTGQTAPPPPSGVDWTASLTPELRQVVEVKGYKTPADVVRAYAHAEKAIGADKILLPNKETGEWDAEARTKLGIPAEPTGYKVERPTNLPQGLDYDDKFEAAALAAGHKLGLLPHQVQGLIQFYTGYQSNVFTSGQQEASNAMATAEAGLKKEWGTAYDVNVNRAKIAAKHFGGDGLVNMLNASGLGNHPELVRAFAKIGGQMSEDQLRIGEGASFGITPEQAKREIGKLRATEAFLKKDHPEHAEAVEKMSAFYAQAYPDA
jgi:hypothetical protein